MSEPTPFPFPADRKVIVGAIHLLPLPGSPRWSAAGRPSLEATIDRALSDTTAYIRAGFDGLIVENYGDAPFLKDEVAPETTAALAIVARRVVERAGRYPVGVNMLRNDARAALGCAVASGAAFVRVNVHTGVAATDQGVIEGRAAETLRVRESLGASVAIFADVHVKHARPLDGDDVGRAAEDAAYRGLADALIVSGAATGSAPPVSRVEAVRTAVPDRPLWLGSGLTREGCASLVPLLDGAIAGSAAQVGGKAGNPVDPDAAKILVQAFRRAEG